MAAITPGGILQRVVDELPNFFRDGVDQLVTGEGEYIRSGQPQGTVGKVGQAIARSFCRQYGADPSAAKFGNAERIENACRPYLDDQDPDKGARIGLPFEGGQCPAGYNIAVEEWDFSTGSFVAVTTLSVNGPLVSLTRTQTSAFGYLFVALGTAGSTQSVTRQAIFGNLPRFGPITLQSGLPDNCGDPPPVVTQPRPIADPTPPPFRFNPDGDINVNVGVDVLPNGTINVNVGGPSFNVDLFPPSPGGGTGGPGGGNDPVGGPGTAGGSTDTGLGGVDDGSAGAGEELVGVLVQVLSAPANANRFFNNAAVVYRGAYYVAMGYPGRLGLDMSGGTAESLQFFHAQQRGLTDYRVRANVGFNLRVTPYYRNIEL